MGPLRADFNKKLIEIHTFHSRKSCWKCRLENGGHFSRPLSANKVFINLTVAAIVLQRLLEIYARPLSRPLPNWFSVINHVTFNQDLQTSVTILLSFGVILSKYYSSKIMYILSKRSIFANDTDKVTLICPMHWHNMQDGGNPLSCDPTFKSLWLTIVLYILVPTGRSLYIVWQERHVKICMTSNQYLSYYLYSDCSGRPNVIWEWQLCQGRFIQL